VQRIPTVINLGLFLSRLFNDSLSTGGLRVFGYIGQCLVRGPRALKNVVRYGFVLDPLLFIRTVKTGSGKHIVLLYPKALHALHHFMLDTLRAASRGAPGPRATSHMP
jgi:hypothetical protein